MTGKQKTKLKLLIQDIRKHLAMNGHVPAYFERTHNQPSLVALYVCPRCTGSILISCTESGEFGVSGKTHLSPCIQAQLPLQNTL